MTKLRLPASVDAELTQLRKDATIDQDRALVIEINGLPKSSVLRAEWLEAYKLRGQAA